MIFRAGTDRNASTSTDTTIEVCPKCHKRSLHVQYMSGEDDHGRIEGVMEVCVECGYEGGYGGHC